jgi:hypothetical protein
MKSWRPRLRMRLSWLCLLELVCRVRLSLFKVDAVKTTLVRVTWRQLACVYLSQGRGIVTRLADSHTLLHRG